ncbi:hypothetical protein ACFV2Q_31680, partial [Streptomyces sp. NPDC059650]|uniref:hypothetical protein n=1 Tax=Streptomyces sp. NPDC059650 TaxID=3346896 RepID=UPI0036B33BB5
STPQTATHDQREYFESWSHHIADLLLQVGEGSMVCIGRGRMIVEIVVLVDRDHAAPADDALSGK